MAVHIVLEEIGIPFACRRVSVIEGETGREPYLSVNPKGRVPALEWNGNILTEVTAILCFLASRHPEAELLPFGELRRARCLEWLSWLASEVHPAFGQLWRPNRSVADATLFPQVQAQGRQNILDRFAFLEEALSSPSASNPWAQGFTLVDPLLLVYYRWGQMMKFDMASFPRWSERCAATMSRPATVRALQREAGRPEEIAAIA